MGLFKKPAAEQPGGRPAGGPRPQMPKFQPTPPAEKPAKSDQGGKQTMSLSDKIGHSVKNGPGTPGGVPTVVGEETKIEGKITSKGNLRIDGEIEGEIFADDTVVIGPAGKVLGNIEARVILIGGTISGNVRASDKLEIQPQGNIQGDVYTPYGRLIIEEGARLEGKCAMTKDVQLSAGAKRPTVVEATPKKPDDLKKSEQGA